MLILKSRRENSYIFKCRDLETRESRVFNFKMLGLFKAADQAFRVMKSPKDMFFLDLDNSDKWKVVNENQLKKL